MGRPYTNLAGIQFGNVTVIDVVEDSGGASKAKRWNCKCNLCGKEFTAASNHLVAGEITKCRSCANRIAATRHGYSKDALYGRWVGMIQRCYHSNNKSFKHWGGRGIEICNEWGAGNIKDIDGFLAFKDWSVEHGFASNLEIDRIDVNGPYAPWNCRWVRKTEQHFNKTNTVTLTIDGITKPLMEWANEAGIKADTLRARIKRGMDAKTALLSAT